MRIRLLVTSVVVAVGSIGVSAPNASASGALNMNAPVSANLGSGAPGTTISAAIGPVTVTDDRALLSASWTVTAAETDFSNGAQTIPATDASYDPGSITTTGTITATGTPVTLSNTAQPVVTGSNGVGDNTASWNPTVAVAVPAGAVGGTYTGTLTQSVDGGATLVSTTLTFTITSGALSLSAPASANLGSGAPGTTISAPIGPLTVTDDRALLSASWTVTAAETDFSNGASIISATDATYAPGTITTTGTITATPTNVTLSNTAQTVLTGSAGVGDNTASWNPTVAVAVPANAVPGTYTGTLIHSVDPDTTITFTVVRGTPTTPTITNIPASPTFGNSFAASVATTGDGSKSVTSSTPSTCTVAGDGLTVNFVRLGTCVLTAHVAQGTSYNAADGSAQSFTVGCNQTVTGTTKSLKISSTGATCVSGADVGGNLTVPAGATLVLTNSTVRGSVRSTRSAGVTICGSTIHSSLYVAHATGPVLVGDAGDDPTSCAGNTISGRVTLTGNTANTEFAANHSSSVSFVNNTGPAAAAPEAGPEVEGNTITGHLVCHGNDPTIANDGIANSVTGASTGQCSGL